MTKCKFGEGHMCRAQHKCRKTSSKTMYDEATEKSQNLTSYQVLDRIHNSIVNVYICTAILRLINLILYL